MEFDALAQQDWQALTDNGEDLTAIGAILTELAVTALPGRRGIYTLTDDQVGRLQRIGRALRYLREDGPAFDEALQESTPAPAGPVARVVDIAPRLEIVKARREEAAGMSGPDDSSGTLPSRASDPRPGSPVDR